MPARYKPKFNTVLWKYPAGNWVFALVPDKFAPPVTHGWGRTPVVATVDGVKWKTSVWRGKVAEPSWRCRRRSGGERETGIESWFAWNSISFEASVA